MFSAVNRDQLAARQGRSDTMDENQERGKGMWEEAKGNIKQGIGNLTGNEQMQAEGRAEELKGEGRQETAKTVGTVKGMGEEAKGNLKQAVGDLIGNEQMEAEGRAEELKGEGRQKFNQ
jgi:uncharacterized protein YjbJ (UPF0337 family)